MITVDLEQGTDEWKDWRDSHWGASDANKLMGSSSDRNKLLREKATGEKEQFDGFTLALFDKGHKAEADARPIVEQYLVQMEPDNSSFVEWDAYMDEGESFLLPRCGVVEPGDFPKDLPEAVRDTLAAKLSASFDGITADGKLVWEHKLANKKLIAALDDGMVPATHYWQLEHQLLVSGAERAIMCSSDGTAENMHMAWYTSKPERRAKLIEAWVQFSRDVESYLPPIDATELQDFQSLENRRSLIADQMADLKQQDDAIKAEMRSWHEVNAHAKQVVQGRDWQIIPVKGRSMICWEKAFKTEAPHIDLEKYRVHGEDSVQIRRVK
jgi:hypothetical protein